MTTSERVSTLEHLTEMDRLLRDIQAELLPDREPAPALADVAAAEAPATAPPPVAAAEAGAAPERTASDGQIQALTELSERLIASMRELLAGYERLLRPGAPTPARHAVRRPDAPDVVLSAGPFPSLPALREFEQAVSRLPGVREVAIQAYEGTDRAIIEVRLDHPSP